MRVTINRAIIIVTAVLAVLLPETSHAELKGKKVVFVHGLQPNAIFDLTLRYNRTKRELDSHSQSGPELDKIIDDRLYYHSGRRLYQNIPYLKEQLKRLELSGDCAAGCYFITTSTGDVVTRYVIENLSHWGIDPKKLWVIASFDIVGAGGGTELADLGVTLLENNSITQKIKEFFESFVPHEFWLVGMGHNIRPTVARATARQHKDVPHLRIAGRGDNAFGALTEPILRGGDDSVVPLHSACGSAKIERIWSCSNKREMGGKNVGWTSGAGSFMHNHFPILMARDMHHTQFDYKGIIVPLNNNRRFDGENGSTTNVSFNEIKVTETTGRWWWKRTNTYTYVKRHQNDNNKTLAGYFIDEFR